MNRTGRFHPFRDGDTFATFANITDKAVSEIEALENDYVLKAAPSELEQYYRNKVELTPLTLDSENYYIESQAGTQIDVSHDWRRARYGNERSVVKGTSLEIAIPFTGDGGLFRVRPSSYSMGGYPEIEVRSDTIVFHATFADDSPNPEALKAEILRVVKSLSDAVSTLATDVARHNSEAPRTVQSALERKLAKARAATSAVASLGIPIRAKAAPETYVVPTKRRETPLSKPVVPTEHYTPEPALEQREFDHILGVLRSMALVIERSPASFASLDEEAIRTHFLLQLNGHYEGTATGETFNSVGKTDILIRVENRNVFIAECKFWRGAKSFTEAVDQLLGYLSWRDSKCALLIFNQTKDSSAVRAKMHEIMVARPEYRKTSLHQPQGESRYVFVKAGDPGREVNVHTMLFDVPKPGD